MCAIVVPLPFGFAISRYTLFDLQGATRQAMVRILYVVSVALILTFGSLLFFFEPGSRGGVDSITLFVMWFAFAAAIELTGGYRLVDLIMHRERSWLGRIRESFAKEIGELRTHDEIAALLGEAIATGLRPQMCSVFLRSSQSWRVARSFGLSPPLQLRLVREALKLRWDRSVLSLRPPRHPSELGSQLSRVGVELAIVLGNLHEPGGLVLLSGSRERRPYGSTEIEFAATLADNASLALHNADLASDLMRNERHATAGRLAIALAHDLGKDLDWMKRLATRLPDRLADRQLAARDLGSLLELVQEVRETVRRFVRNAAPLQMNSFRTTELDRMIEGAVDVMLRRYREPQITYSISPAARSSQIHENAYYVLLNLLDNAVQANPMGRVHIFCTCESSSARITVTDCGPGIPDRIVDSIFEPGVSTRYERGGMGAGLAISRDIVDSLSGTLELEPAPGGGTCAVFVLPIGAGAATDRARKSFTH
jgi:signal transduction histidine kinase